MMEITTNKPINNTTLEIVKNGFEEQKGVYIVSIYKQEDDIYGIYINDPYDSLSFISAPLYNMKTDIDGHNIFMMELGFMLQLIYNNGSLQMFNLLNTPSAIDCSNNCFLDLLNVCSNNPPLNLASFHLIEWIDKMNDGDSVMDIQDLVYMGEQFNIVADTKIRFDEAENEAYYRNQLNEMRQVLKQENYKKVTEAIINEIDRLFIKMQLDLYMTDD